MAFNFKLYNITKKFPYFPQKITPIKSSFAKFDLYFKNKLLRRVLKNSEENLLFYRFLLESAFPETRGTKKYTEN